MPKSINKGVVAIPIVAVSALMLMAPMLASAQSPHFIRASSSVDSDKNLVCSFKEAGLGDNQLIHYTCTADATANYECQNRGANQKNPPAENKDSVSGPVSAEDTFNSGKNGQITKSLTAEPPGPGDFECPPGQNLVLASVSYTNVVLTDTTNNISVELNDVSA
jgi:hypothetical protein